MDIRNRIKSLCDSRGWSYYELSLRAGLSVNTAYNWKNKNIIPTIPIIEKICEAFEITIEQFFSEGNSLLTEQEKQVLEAWHSLSDLEQKALCTIINTFRSIKRN